MKITPEVLLLGKYISRLVEGDDVFPELQTDMERLGLWDSDGFPTELLEPSE